MGPGTRGVFGVMLLIVAAIASPARAQILTQGSQAQPTGTGRITGRVLATDNRAAVRRALVRLTGLTEALPDSNPRAVHKEVETDDNGAFEFEALPRGSYSIDVPRMNGFVGTERGTRVVVGDTGAIDKTIQLVRTGALVGRITDRHGDGVIGIEVLALHRRDFRGHVTWLPEPFSRGSTDDRGYFRVFNLSPGEYAVVAAPASPTPHQRTMRGFGFVTTYYPGSPLLSDARRVVVRAGKDTAKVSFALASGPFARVAVDAVDSHGLPLGREATATLNHRDQVHFISSMRRAQRQEDGQFVFGAVPAGDYFLVVNTSFRIEEAAYVDVRVDTDVTLRVQTNTGAKLSGRIIVQGAPRDEGSRAKLGRPVVSANRPPGSVGPSYTGETMGRQLEPDRFEVSGVRGPMMLHAQMYGAALVSIGRAGGPDLAGKTLDYVGTETIDDLEVVFTTERVEVEVTLTGLREPDDPENVLVMLFGEEPARWHTGSLHYTSIEASAEMPLKRGGRTFTFRLGPVVPGRYLLAAVPSPRMSFPTNPAILERLRSIAVPVTLVAGETAKAEVRVSRAAK